MQSKQKAPDSRNTSTVRDDKTIPRCHPALRKKFRTLLGDTSISPADNAGHTLRNTKQMLFPAPSAVHLTGRYTAPFPATEALCKFVSCFYLRFNGLKC